MFWKSFFKGVLAAWLILALLGAATTLSIVAAIHLPWWLSLGGAALSASLLAGLVAGLASMESEEVDSAEL